MSKNFNIALVIGSYHKKETAIMEEAASYAAKDLGLSITEKIWVPGSMEKPLAVKRVISRRNICGVVVLGIIERGETAHGLVMGQAVIQSLIKLQIDFDKPIGIGILGPNILPDQIPARIKPYAEDAVKAVYAMLDN